MPPVKPEAVSNHPLAKRFARDRAAMQLRELLAGERRPEVAIPLTHERQRQRANLARQSVVARPSASLGYQAGRAVLAQQPQHLAPAQPDQAAGVPDAQPDRHATAPKQEGLFACCVEPPKPAGQHLIPIQSTVPELSKLPTCRRRLNLP